MSRPSKKTVVGYTLTDAEAQAREHAKTFRIPDKKIRNKLVPPKDSVYVVLVKLIFLPKDGANGERMWVKVSGRERGCYVGTLDSFPSNRSLGLSAGDTVRFGAKNVTEVDVIRPDNGIVATLKAVFDGW